MSDRDNGSPGWVDTIRHWLWLDRTQRTDNSEANRGFYANRKPVGWRFVLPVVAAGIVIALIVLAARDVEARPGEDGQRLVFDEPGFAVTLPADWEVELNEPWEEPCGDTVWASAGHGGVWDGDQHCAFTTSQCLSASLISYPPGHARFESPYEWLDLPAGRALYVEDEQFEPHVVAYFSFTRGVKDHVIVCHAAEPPEDRWRSIAESFEFLREEHEIVVTRPALAPAFPGEWTVLEDRGQATGAPGWAGLIWASDGVSTCGLQYDTRPPDTSRPQTSDDVHAAYRAWLSIHRADVVGSVEVDLSIGPALRTDWAMGWPEDQMAHSTYELDAGDAHLRFVCGAATPPEDRWLSLAETLTTDVDGH